MLLLLTYPKVEICDIGKKGGRTSNQNCEGKSSFRSELQASLNFPEFNSKYWKVEKSGQQRQITCWDQKGDGGKSCIRSFLCVAYNYILLYWHTSDYDADLECFCLFLPTDQSLFLVLSSIPSSITRIQRKAWCNINCLRKLPIQAPKNNIFIYFWSFQTMQTKCENSR